MTTILIADDEPNIRDVVKYALEREGFRVLVAANGEEALAIVGRGGVDLLVLDILMPELDGLEVCRRLRGGGRGTDLPVIFLSSKGEEIDRVVGLELGSDDYLAKPFSPRELVARVRAVLRRRAAPAPQAAREKKLAVGDVTMDVERHEVKVGAAQVALTATEFAMLRALCERPGMVLSRRQLVDRAISADHHITERTVDSHIRRIRAKLREAGAEDVVATVHGIGYKCSD
jgi:two-component system OmpR family response regulator